MAQIRSKPFGVTKEGANVTEYILSNPGGMSVSVLDYGCVIKNIIVPAKNGPVDVVLGHDTMADYENDFTSSGSTCCGAFVGRYANRIENAVFTLGGKTYQLEKKLRRAPSARLLLPQDLYGEVLWRYPADGSRKPPTARTAFPVR